MKKIFLLTVFVSLFCFAGNAQLLSFGIKGGVNLSTLTNSKTIPIHRETLSLIEIGEGTSSYRTGFVAGGFLALKIPFIGIQAEVLFSKQGLKNEGKITGTRDYKTDLILNYLTVPVLAQFYLVPKILNVELGPQFGFFIKAKQTTDFTLISTNNTETVKLDDNLFRETDLSLIFGIGLKLPKLPIGINARYIVGLNETYLNSPNNKKMRNGVFQITAFLKFKII